MTNPSTGDRDSTVGAEREQDPAPSEPRCCDPGPYCDDLPGCEALRWETCGAEYDWERDGHPGGAQPACGKPRGHESGPATDWKRHEHSNGQFHWPAEATRA